MSYQIDIAQLLFQKAGEHLVEAKNNQTNLKKEAEACIQAIVLFQSAMEAIITEEIENESKLQEVKRENENLYTKFKSLSFKNKWERAFEVLKINQREELNTYFDFYSHFRIPILHPVRRYISLDGYTYEKVEEGLENGWKLMQLLNKALGKTQITWEDFKKSIGL